VKSFSTTAKPIRANQSSDSSYGMDLEDAI
jgi:hypothetical protein